MKKILWVGSMVGIAILVVLIYFLCFFEPAHVVETNCLPYVLYNINLTYNGLPLEGYYYWVDTGNNLVSLYAIENSTLKVIKHDFDSNFKDTSLKIVHLGEELPPAVFPAYAIGINNDLDYSDVRGEVEISKERILGGFYFLDTTKDFFEIKDFFDKDFFYVNNVTIDLSQEKVVSSNSQEDLALCIPQEFV